MKSLRLLGRSVTLACTLASTLVLTTAGVAVAQVTGDNSTIPENPPRNWSDLFLGKPIMAVAILLAVVVVVAYVAKMIRMRYPRSS